MNEITYFEASDFRINNILSKKEKEDKKILVVFSTFGEREADLIYDKVSLLKAELDGLVDRFILSHRRAGKKAELTEKRAREADGDIDIVVCNDFSVPDMKAEKGKGADMRRTLYHINKKYREGRDEKNIIIIYLDADVVAKYFGSHFVTGLGGSVIAGYDFAKASFWRAMGRVKKYVAQTLFSVIDHPALENLKAFSYPLSGEVAGTLEFFNSVQYWQIYGVETGINIDSCFGGYRVADVNLGLYDHEHHPDLNIQKMSFGIIRTFLLQMIDYGLIELKDNAKVSHIFKSSHIDMDGKRQFLEFDLSERKYAPMKTIL